MSLTSHNDFGDKVGAFIANISPGGIAAKAGKLRSGDKVISVSDLFYLCICLFVYLIFFTHNIHSAILVTTYTDTTSIQLCL